MKALRPLSYTGVIARILAALIALWPLALVGAIALSPTGPHVLWRYEYYEGSRPAYGAPRTRVYTRCTYLGTRGYVTPDFAPQCPWVVILNAKHWKTS